MASSPEDIVLNSKELEDLLTRLQDSLTQATNKNNSLLESLETVESRAIDYNNGELSLIRNLRARLSATHLPNAELRKSLPVFLGLFLKCFNDLKVTLKCYNELNIKLQQDSKDLDEHILNMEKDRENFDKERESWRKNLEQARKEITEQNDRLTLLSQQLSGEKNELEIMNNELASKRIAFEEDKLIRENTTTTTTTQQQTSNDEADILRRKLREQALSNIHIESTLLRTEVSLHQREDAINKYEETITRLHQEIQQLRMTSSKAVKQFEKRTKEANIKLSEMNSELSKAQEHAHRFQDLLTAERRKQKALQHALDQSYHVQTSNDIPIAHKAYIDTLSETLQATKPHHNTTDIIRKSECVLVENANLKAEIRKLRIENDDLMKRVKFADANAHYLRNRVVTSLHDRATLIKKIHLKECKLKEIGGAFDQQAEEWISQKKKEKTDYIKSQFKQIKPISSLAAGERTWNNGPAKTQSLSRSNIQVTKW